MKVQFNGKYFYEVDDKEFGIEGSCKFEYIEEFCFFDKVVIFRGDEELQGMRLSGW